MRSSAAGGDERWRNPTVLLAMGRQVMVLLAMVRQVMVLLAVVPVRTMVLQVLTLLPARLGLRQTPCRR